jgi:hypothetical protein
MKSFIGRQLRCLHRDHSRFERLTGERQRLLVAESLGAGELEHVELTVLDLGRAGVCLRFCRIEIREAFLDPLSARVSKSHDEKREVTSFRAVDLYTTSPPDDDRSGLLFGRGRVLHSSRLSYIQPLQPSSPDETSSANGIRTRKQ